MLCARFHHSICRGFAIDISSLRGGILHLTRMVPPIGIRAVARGQVIGGPLGGAGSPGRELRLQFVCRCTVEPTDGDPVMVHPRDSTVSSSGQGGGAPRTSST